MRAARRRGTPFPPTVGRPKARLALHHLLDETHTGMGDAREEIKPNVVGDMRPVAVKNILVENVRGNNVNVEERGEHEH